MPRLCLGRWLAVVGSVALGVLVGGAAEPNEKRPGHIVPAEAGVFDPAQLRSRYGRRRSQWPSATIDAGVAFVELGSLEQAARRNSPRDPELELGRRLFLDPRLSASGRVACSQCHDPAKGWGDGQAVSVGEAGKRGRRNATALYSTAYRSIWGWDGAGSSLAAQASRPLFDPAEMGNPDAVSLLRNLAADDSYRSLFQQAYGAGPITTGRIGEALSALLAGLEEPTRFDSFARGDTDSFSDQEILGLHLFRTKARCANCHFGPLLSDDGFHNLRLSSFHEPREDLGRYGVTGSLDAVGRFRTPSLRHVARTAPYMHNGLFPTLEGVVNLYARGGGEVWARNELEAAHPLYPHAAELSPHIRPLKLSPDEKAALLAFLRTL